MRGFFDAGDGTRTKAVWRALSPVFALALIGDVLRGRRRSFAADAARLLCILCPQLRVENASLIPPEGPFVVVMDHYCRQGLGAWWGVFLMDQAIAHRRTEPGEMRWIMTSGWTYQDPIRSRLMTPLTHWLFRRIARLAPEGQDSSDGGLIDSPAGAGRFLLLLAKAGLRILPVGLAEKNGTLIAPFGEPFNLEDRPGPGKRGRDRSAGETAMVAIGKLLLPELWGTYREQIGAKNDLS
jgi:hypothetical protein